MNIATKFDIRDRVIINGDESVITTVQRIVISSPGIGCSTTAVYEVSWFSSSGDVKEHTFYEWQLGLVK